MKIRRKQEGFIQMRLVVVITVAVVVIIGSVGGAYAFTDYNKLMDTVAQADQLSSEERHSEAISLLQPTQDNWLVHFAGVKDGDIKDRIDEFEARVDQQGTYQQAIEQGREKDWEAVIDLLSQIPEDSFYRHRSEVKTEEARRALVESRLEAEQQAREAAEKVAIEDAQARQVAEAKADEETRLRAAEEQARQDAEARASVEAALRAQEEVARQQAEQEAQRQRLAKEQQQQAAESQRIRADQEEKARVLELAQTNPVIKAIVSGELRFYIDPLPSYAGTGVANAVDDVASSFSSWSPYGANIRRVYSTDSADLTVSWIRDYGSHTLGESIYRAHIKVGLGQNNCVGEWRAFDSNTVKKVLWHELGHSMGYGHSSAPNNVMYFQTATKFEVDSEISEVISGGWYYTFRICGSGTFSYSFQTDDPNTGFDLFVLPPGEDPNGISGGGGNFYVGCGKEGMHSYSGSCSVAEGSLIYIGNTSYSSAIRLSGSITSRNIPPWPNMTWDQEAYQYDEDELERYWDLFH